MTEQPPTPGNPSKYLWLIVLGCIGLVVSISCLVCALVGMSLFNWGDTITHGDFASDQACVDYVNGLLPITLPAGTDVDRMIHTGFQDWYLEFDGTLPAGEVDTFIDSLPAPIEPVEDRPNLYQGDFGADSIYLQIDPATGEIWIEFIEA